MKELREVEMSDVIDAGHYEKLVRVGFTEMGTHLR